MPAINIIPDSDGRKETTRQWIERHVSYDGDECLIYPFKRYVNGYGGTRVDGVETYAHRHMCRVKHGPPPTAEHEAAHTCGNGKLGCIHPSHLRWATHFDNMADMERHGTMTRGEDNAMAKLTADAVIEIRRLRGTVSQTALAARYGVTQSAVYMVLSGRSWKHIA